MLSAGSVNGSFAEVFGRDGRGREVGVLYILFLGLSRRRCEREALMAPLHFIRIDLTAMRVRTKSRVHGKKIGSGIGSCQNCRKIIIARMEGMGSGRLEESVVLVSAPFLFCTLGERNPRCLSVLKFYMSCTPSPVQHWRCQK